MNGKRTINRILGGLLIMVLLLATALPTQVARAATITVTSTSGGIGGPDCTLRDAITAADTDNATGGCPAGNGADTIVLASGATYTLTEIHNPPNATDGLPAIHSQITIQGNGSIIERSIADGTPEFRIFYVAAEGDLTLNELTVTNGDSQFDGGGIKNWGALTINDSIVSGNSDSGISTLEDSSVYIYNSTISDNSGGNADGGISNNRGSVVIYNSNISGNDNNVRGGGINNYLGSVDIYTSTISDNTATLEGGGIYNRGGVLTLTNTTVSDNTAGEDGGGIWNLEGSNATITDSTISNNNANSRGGGIFNYTSSVLTLIDSTINENSVGLDGTTGGIHNGSSSEATLINSTVSNNYNGVGGGIWNSTSSTITLTNSTISHNSPYPSYLGGIVNYGEMILKNTIIADQLSGGDCYLGEAVTSLGYNLDSDGTCNLTAAGDISGVDPLLGPLADNGGPTLTRALLEGSPAIDAVPTANCTLETDQRGVTRPQGAACDIGAFELDVIVINDMLNLDEVSTSYDPYPAPEHPAGIYTISSTFTNISTAFIEKIHFLVTRLSGGNLLLNADGGPGGEGATLSVPDYALGEDGVLEPGESFTVDFQIGLQRRRRFSFIVDAYGKSFGDSLFAPVSTIGVGSYEFEVSNADLGATELFLPMLGR
jgi:hypothetical protein